METLYQCDKDSWDRNPKNILPVDKQHLFYLVCTGCHMGYHYTCSVEVMYKEIDNFGNDSWWHLLCHGPCSCGRKGVCSLKPSSSCTSCRLELNHVLYDAQPVSWKCLHCHSSSVYEASRPSSAMDGTKSHFHPFEDAETRGVLPSSVNATVENTPTTSKDPDLALSEDNILAAGKEPDGEHERNMEIDGTATSTRSRPEIELAKSVKETYEDTTPSTSRDPDVESPQDEYFSAAKESCEEEEGKMEIDGPAMSTRSCQERKNGKRKLRWYFGPITTDQDLTNNRGVLVGDTWKNKVGCRLSGVHMELMSGIAGNWRLGTCSICLSQGYLGDADHGDWFIYTGRGGKMAHKIVRTDICNVDFQTAEKVFKHSYNASLRKTCIDGLPVRVVRSYMLKGSKYAPKEKCSFYRYDGIYRVEKFWMAEIVKGFRAFRFLFVRCDNDPPPWLQGTAGSHIEDLSSPLDRFGKSMTDAESAAADELKHSVGITERPHAPSWDWKVDEKQWGWVKDPPSCVMKGGKERGVTAGETSSSLPCSGEKLFEPTQESFSAESAEVGVEQSGNTGESSDDNIGNYPSYKRNTRSKPERRRFLSKMLRDKNWFPAKVDPTSIIDENKNVSKHILSQEYTDDDKEKDQIANQI